MDYIYTFLYELYDYRLFFQKYCIYFLKKYSQIFNCIQKKRILKFYFLKEIFDEKKLLDTYNLLCFLHINH